MKVISTFLQEGSPQLWVGVDPLISTNRHLSYHKSTKLSRGQSPCSIILEDDLDTPSTHKNGGVKDFNYE